MRSKTSFFNRTLFFKTVSRFWPIWGGYLFIWLVTLPLALGSSLSWARNMTEADSYGQSIMSIVQKNPLTTAHDAGLIMAVIFCLFMAMAVYGFLYFSRSAGAYCSLPLDRRCLFITLTSAGIIPLLLANVAVFVVAALVELAFGALYLPALLGFLAISSMEVLFFFGLAAICAMLTGNIVVLPPLYVVLNFCAYLVEEIVKNLLEQFVYGYHSSGVGYCRFLSPVVQLWQSTTVTRDGYYKAFTDGGTTFITTGYHFEGYLMFLIYALVGAALLVGAFYLLRRRAIESAGDVVAVKPLRPIFKYSMAVGCGLALGLLLFSVTNAASHSTTVQAAALLIFLLLGCLLGYFASEMMLKKTFRVFRGKGVWLGCGVTCVVLAALFLCCEFDVFGYERRVPDPAEVEQVFVSGNGEACIISEKENIDAVVALQRQVIENKAWHEVQQDNGVGVRLNLTYTLKDGRELTRSYDLRLTLDDSKDVYELQNLMNSNEAIAKRKATAYPIEVGNINYACIDYAVPEATEKDGYREVLHLTEEEAYELYTQCLLPDIADGTLGRVWFVEDENYISTVYSCSINIECNRRNAGSGDYEYMSFYTVPTVDSVRTNEWFAKRGIELMTYAECGQTPWYEYMEKYAYDDAPMATVNYYK